MTAKITGTLSDEDLLPIYAINKQVRCCCRRRCSRPADSDKVLRCWLAVYVSLTKLTIHTSTLLMGSFSVLTDYTLRSGFRAESIDSAITVIRRGTRTRTKGNTY